MTRHLHIVCLDTPWPADYGGAIDMFCRIQALHEAGISIHLHYFSYNHRGNPNELNRYCTAIHVYKRKKGWKGFSFRQPYIVSSRVNHELAEQLNKDDHPVLLEGIHCTGILPLIMKKERKIIVRLHNEESLYYRHLSGATRNPFKKIYFRLESWLLKKYQRRLPRQISYACITPAETKKYRDTYGLEQAFYLPVFIPWEKVEGKEGMGNFCLYHGNLSVPENEKAAAWLLTKVFCRIRVPLVIAGRNPSKRLDKMAHLCQHTCLVRNPTPAEIDDLVKKAHIHVLPSFSTTGIKLKLLHALFEGRHCVVNRDMVEGTGLESACHCGTNARAIASIVTQLHHQPFGEEEIRIREKILHDRYDNRKNAALLIQHVW